eukprot:scaffold3239_cov19-Prasinocladus_malaysianus.AAC.1
MCLHPSAVLNPARRKDIFTVAALGCRARKQNGWLTMLYYTITWGKQTVHAGSPRCHPSA